MARINRAIDHVLAHLDQPLQLEDVARVACFSTFHFHRVFRSLMGETLHQFVKRLRLEHSLRLMSRFPNRSLTDVALECGFTSSSDFSRSFRQRFGVPPSVFEVETFRAQRRQEWLAAIEDPAHRHQLQRLPVGENPDNFQVEFRDLPARRVAYIRVLNPYRPEVVPDAAARLVQWVRRNQRSHGAWLGYMWDDPDVVAHKECRYDAGVELPDAQPDGEVGVVEFPAAL